VRLETDGETTIWPSSQASAPSLRESQQTLPHLDIKRPEEQAIFHRLAETADVVAENFRPGVMSDDFRSAVQAFVEKRKYSWTGR
jgi:crotonobetainyl-CoA:carnitine CoA-transferase CaiB-like acyl-CoA transferase